MACISLLFNYCIFNRKIMKTNREIPRPSILTTAQRQDSVLEFRNFTMALLAVACDNQDYLINRVLFDSHSIVEDTLEWLCTESIQRSEVLIEMKKHVPRKLDYFFDFFETILTIQHQELEQGIGNSDDEPKPCDCHMIATVLRENQYIKAKLQNLLRKKPIQNILTDILNTQKEPQQLNLTLNSGLKRQNKFTETDTKRAMARTEYQSLVSLEIPKQPQSPTTKKIRQESYCQITDPFRQRKELLLENQRRNIDNFKNMSFTFDYSSEKINVYKAQRIKTPGTVAIMRAQCRNSQLVQKKSNMKDQDFQNQHRRSTIIRNLMQISLHQTNHSHGLKSLLDRIINSSKPLKVTHSHKAIYSRKKLF